MRIDRGSVVGDREDQILRLASGERQRAHVQQPAVGAPLQADRARLLPEVLDVQVGGPGLRAAPHRQRGEPDIFAGNPQAVVVDRKGQAAGKRRPQRLDDPVAEQVGARIVAGPDEASREAERRRQVGRAIARADLVQRPVQAVAIRADGGDDPRGGPHRDDGHPVLRPELIDQAVDLAFRLGEPRRRDIRRLHRRRGIDQHDAVSCQRRAGREDRLHRRRHQHRGREQLKEQQPAGAQPLPRDVGLPVANLVGPEVQGRHDPGGPANFQEVQGDDRRQRQPEDGGGRRQQRHASRPMRRRVSWTISSIGSAVDIRAKRKPRR